MTIPAKVSSVASSVAEGGEWEGAEYEMPVGQTFGIGKVVMGPMETPVCFMARCEDTEGNTFSLHHRKDGSVG